MEAATQAASSSGRRVPSGLYMNELSSKKTAFILVTVIGCCAILWPSVFYPMMFGGSAPKANLIKEQRAPGGCCDVVLDRELFANATDAQEIGPQLYRKHFNLFTDEISLRQERPTHLHPESIYQAMRERGRAIPATPTVPIIDKKSSANTPQPRIVEGRPGPIPGMRPPMGAGSSHQQQPKGNSMGFVMPLYTIGIIVFFAYTILKIVFKKSPPNAPYGPAPVDPNFRKEVFGQENSRHVEDLTNPKIVVTAIQGLIDAADEHLKIREKNMTDSVLPKESSENTNSKNGSISDEHTTEHNAEEDVNLATDKSQNLEENQQQKDSQQRKRKEGSVDRSVAVIGIDVTASCEGGQKWTGRPPTPIFSSHNEHSDDVEIPEPQSIYLEGSLAHDTQILVSDSETKAEEVYDAELNGSAEEPAVVLSSKMTLSLINLDKNKAFDNDTESPLGDDIEIIGHDEK